MMVLVAAGERISVDGRVTEGISDLDCSLVTGESMPRNTTPGSQLRAGTLNLTAPLKIAVTAVARDSFLAETVRLMELAVSGRARYRRIADRAAQFYAPFVHTAAFLAFLGWMAVNADVHQSLTIAVAVLIITCPCALGLAVPMVQVVAARRLFDQGILIKDGSAMERLGAIDTVVFDKTGTLTQGRPRLCNLAELDPANLALGAALAAHSRHPFSQALVAAVAGKDGPSFSFDSISEHPGCGLEAVAGTRTIRLGRADWALDSAAAATSSPQSRAVLSNNGQLLETFIFDDPARPGAHEAIAQLKDCGLFVEILSGDDAEPVARLAGDLGIKHIKAGVLPCEKVSHLASLEADGRTVLMVGDGLNDAPALAAAHVSMRAGKRGRCRPQRCRFRFPAEQSRCHSADAGHRSTVEPADQAKFWSRHHLQHHCASLCGSRIC